MNKRRNQLERRSALALPQSPDFAVVGHHGHHGVVLLELIEHWTRLNSHPTSPPAGGSGWASAITAELWAERNSGQKSGLWADNPL